MIYYFILYFSEKCEKRFCIKSFKSWAWFYTHKHTHRHTQKDTHKDTGTHKNKQCVYHNIFSQACLCKFIINIKSFCFGKWFLWNKLDGYFGYISRYQEMRCTMKFNAASNFITLSIYPHLSSDLCSYLTIYLYI